MITYIARRLLQMIPVLIGTTFLIFSLVFLLPGEPWEGRCGERPCPPAYIAQFKEEYNLDKPFFVQYLLYMGKVLQGNLGTNYYGNPVSQELLDRLPTTAILAVMAVTIEVVIGITTGVLAGSRKGKLTDGAITAFTLVLISIPVFVLGGLAQLGVLRLNLGLGTELPLTAANASPPTMQTVVSLIIPAFTLAGLNVAYITRLTRTTMVENLRADFVRTARAKGLTAKRVIFVHTLRNSLIPVITQVGVDLGALMGGAIVTERIFNVNGIGSFMFRSISQQDGASVVGTVLMLVLVYLLANLLVDILYASLDPRISHD